jgi:hypothetical protein
MSDKRKRLVAAAQSTTRQPEPKRLSEGEPKKGYRVVPVSLYTPEAEWLDRTCQVLKQAGNPKANRSLVVREAIHRLEEELREKSPEEVLRYFVERHVQRQGG